MTRTTMILMVAGAMTFAAFACNESSEGEDKVDEAVRAVERAQRAAAKKVEQAGETLREKSADGSLLVQGSPSADGGD